MEELKDLKIEAYDLMKKIYELQTRLQTINVKIAQKEGEHVNARTDNRKN